MTDPNEPEEVDGSDEQDHDAQEQALGLALAALLLAQLLPGPSSFLSGTQSWNSQVDAAVGRTLYGFLQRSAYDLVDDANSLDVAAIEDSTDEVYPQVLSWLQDASHDTLDNLTAAHVDDDSTAQAARVAAENLARGTAVHAKSLVRQTTAGKLGAVYKTWKTRHDDRVRSTHASLEGESIPFDSKFVTDTGAMLRWPGDPEAPIQEIAGCRCHLNYKLKPKDRDFADA